ncbi:MAG: DUF4301 family protein [Deltaproteobacteria bacterium]|nr:DUF4301 family protein [Deltaproteobacteria bacterium]MBW2110312.1 DUF4301 family protein [Deltaproteobacteria bacterium]MBW2352027.1 DUF4301 family protein [Deltaproteobacteria bacterium]HDZ89450.1 DUF4301 family protein [Deltaproteobacteria bacterium]
MDRDTLISEDLRQIEEQGLSAEEVRRQLGLFRMPRPFLRLVRPCTVGDGIRVFDRERAASLMRTWETGKRGLKCLKFVPASGAATRMFKVLLKYLNQGKEISWDAVSREASAGDREAGQFVEFIEGLKRFAFFRDLESALSGGGHHVDTLIEEGRFREILRFLLTDEGLGYAGLPKALLKFHQYPEGSRTAFEEHLVEAASYVAGEDGRCPLHFTVSEEHLSGFEACLGEAGPVYEERYGVVYDLSFSAQARSTDTVAVNPDNTPFRLKDGRLLFRPGGHGALLRNLNRVDADLVFIKNIDNVVPDHLKPETFRWKKLTAGYLVWIRDMIRGHMERLVRDPVDDRSLAEAARFIEDELLLSIPGPVQEGPPEVRRSFLMDLFDRPVRVCGMVKNVGEPGGGPFWVADHTGRESLQIVETAHIDLESREQREIFHSSTHFNPVDLVCGIRDWQGRPFDLDRFVDPGAFLITRKSKDGKDLKALEHPGLWNGSMARWITLFVEVPDITFNPVKTVNDLLRKEHQPAPGRD